MTERIPPNDRYDTGGQRPANQHPRARVGWLQRRQAKVAAELERSRSGDYTVPTWVLSVALAAIIAAWAAIIIFG